MTFAPLVQVAHLSKRFRLDRHHYVGAVNDISFTIGKGETLGLVGESGSGKTTVGRCLLRLIEPSAGSITFAGADLTGASAAELRALRPRLQLVFQDPLASLNPRRTIGQTVAEPLRLHTRQSAAACRAAAAEMLREVGLDASRFDRYPIELTASEQQRVGIARALVTRPDLVVLDEPTSTLDPIMRAEILDVLERMQAALGVSYLFISHDLTAVERLSHRIAVMYLGRLVEIGSTRALMRQQDHPYTRALLSAVLDADPTKPIPPHVVEGEIPSAVNPRDECPFVGRCPIHIPVCRDAMPGMADMGGAHFAACVRAPELVRGAL
ncbi:oligopeptide/dipeptide ABC transporter ATP-binding protein [Chelatococcus reniformis]|uniref:ABC transporter ATP-binding protein n=1 Tax=Chelatococcus reniformis TaxID=1494448 RepID=A0A916TYR2_9HYPH|nr:ABC transporter ATP-binding protein [Chelatococcus reniformis]GGC52863.1 ABC transporter ATP-binding protein [Chelatococcus reniformis]